MSTNSVTLFESGEKTNIKYVICGLLGNYTASCGNCLPTFRDKVSVPSSRVEIPRGKSSWNLDPWGVGGVVDKASDK
jgi:hypothetical protein